MADPNVSLDTVLKEVNEAVARVGEMTGRIASIGDYIGGGIPRAVGEEADASAEKPPAGLLYQIMGSFRELRARHDLLRDEVSRIDTLCGRRGEGIQTHGSFKSRG